MGARTVVMTGAEFVKFVSTPWGDGLYWDDTLFEWNGVETEDIDGSKVNPEDTIVIKYGTVLNENDPDWSFEAVYWALRWRKSQTHASVAVEVDKTKLGELKAYLKKSKIGRIVERASERTGPTPT